MDALKAAVQYGEKYRPGHVWLLQQALAKARTAVIKAADAVAGLEAVDTVVQSGHATMNSLAADDGTEVATAHVKLAQARAAAAAAKQTHSNSGIDACSVLTTNAICIALWVANS
eukprot:19708-Heterococcus_DN1.PRE.3